MKWNFLIYYIIKMEYKTIGHRFRIQRKDGNFDWSDEISEAFKFTKEQAYNHLESTCIKEEYLKIIKV